MNACILPNIRLELNAEGNRIKKGILGGNWIMRLPPSGMGLKILLRTLFVLFVNFIM